jgi:hypothetical protein
LNSSSFSFNSLKGSTINVYSNGGGNKRGILVSNSNQASTRDLNVYVAAPGLTGSTGSYIGIETNDPANTGSIQLRSTTSGIVVPTGAQPYTASDIRQTTPATITNPTYLASAGIQVGPGTDLVTKSAGDKGFSTYVYPETLYYGLKGTLASTSTGWLWPGTQVVTAASFPDPGTPPSYYRVQQPSLMSGIAASVNILPTAGSLTLTAQYSPISDQTPNLGDAVFTGSIAGTTLTITLITSGVVAIGQLLTETAIVPGAVSNRTYIVSGSGLTWKVSNSQTVTSRSMTSSYYHAGATFSGTFDGTGNRTLTITSAVVGTIQIGQYVSATSGATTGNQGVPNGTFIVSGSGTTWTINQNNANVDTAISMLSYAVIPTAFEVSFSTGSAKNPTFYNSSTRLNTGDRVHLLLTSSTSPAEAGAQDLTAQIDLF